MDKALLKDFIWHRAKEIEGQDGEMVRKDMTGAIIRWEDLEKEREYGWCIAPLLPYSKDGTDNIMALLLLHHRNAQSKGDNFPCYTMVVTSENGQNCECSQQWDYLLRVS